METLLLTKANNFFLFGPVADVLGWIMDLLFRFTNLFGIMNIGLCIILFTAVIKLLLLPLTIKQQKSSKLMAVMQPEMKMIQKIEKFCALLLLPILFAVLLVPARAAG